jgi:RHS repeat-associated protein
LARALLIKKNVKRTCFSFLALALLVGVYGSAIFGCGGGSSSTANLTPEPSTEPQKGVVLYINDHLGNAHLITDSKGAVLREESRYPYGLDWRVDGSSATTADYVYTGKEYDEETGLVYFGGRYYSPEMGRWITPDLHFVEKPEEILKRPLEGNLYAYVRDNPVRWIDPNGEAAGDPYPTQHVAAYAAIMDYNPVSIATNIEYGGFIYKMSNGSYSYTPPDLREATSRSVELGTLYSELAKTKADVAAYYHTHAATDPCCYNEIFSMKTKINNELGDIDLAKQWKIDAYLGTPKGRFEYYDKQANTMYILEGSKLQDIDIPPRYDLKMIYESDLHSFSKEDIMTPEGNLQ